MRKYTITNETLKRAGRTFLQAFLGYAVVNIAVVDFNNGKEVLIDTLIGLGVGAIAAGLAAVMNLQPKVEVPVEEIEEIEDDEEIEEVEEEVEEEEAIEVE